MIIFSPVGTISVPFLEDNCIKLLRSGLIIPDLNGNKYTSG